MFNALELLATLRLDSSQYKEGLEEAEKEAGGMGSKIAGGLGTAAKVGAAAVGAAATAVGALTKSAVDGFGRYEQLVGGVETLFKNSAETVVKNSEIAYKTAGMSANDYMETVTSFSASLLQSLGGDTDAAAKVADRAVIDMSDNANKMGTNMESIQNAYQGFAKQNYTMLDNLKLGYGGTKEEMARLVEDAAKMKDVQDELNVSVNEGDMSFANIVNAISVVQKNLDIAGTTAKEAGETIEGSVGSVKAAWDNLVTGFANKDADLGQLIQDLVDSASTAFGNLIPVIQQAITGIASFVEQIAPVITEKLPVVVEQIVPPLLSAGVTLLNSIVSVLPDAALTIITTLVNAIIEYGPMLITSGVDAITQLATGLGQALPDLIPAAVDAIITIVEGLLDNIDKLVDAALQLMVGLAEGLIKALPKVIEKIPTIIAKIVEALIRSVPKIAEAGVKLFSSIVQNLPTIIANIVKSIPSIITSIAKAIVNGIPTLVKAGADLMAGLGRGIINGVSNAVNAAKNAAGNVLGSIKRFFGIASPSKVMTGVGEFIMQGLENGIISRVIPMNRVIDTVNKNLSKIGDVEGLIEEVEVTSNSGSSYSTGLSGMVKNTSSGKSKSSKKGANLTVILELDHKQCAKAVYKLNKEETQRIGVNLAGGYA